MTEFLYRRLPYHLDGTAVFMVSKLTPDYSRTYIRGSHMPLRDDTTDCDPTALEAMNRVDGHTAVMSHLVQGLHILFPTPMRIRGILPFIHQGFWYDIAVWPEVEGPAIYRLLDINVSYSQDAEALVDGTYIDLGIIPQPYPYEMPPYTGPLPGRQDIFALDTRTWVPVIPGEEDNRVVQGELNDYYTPPSPLTLGTRWKEDFVPNYGGVAPYDMRQVTALKLSFIAQPPPPGYRYPSGYNEPDVTAYTIGANLYLYGGPESNAWRNYMKVEDANYRDDTYASQMNWGTVVVDSSSDRGIRIKNHSPTHVANHIEVYFDPGALVNPYRLADMFVMSIDGGITWYSKVILTSLGPGTYSPVIRIRRISIEGDGPTVTQALIRTDVAEWIGPEERVDPTLTHEPRVSPASGHVAGKVVIPEGFATGGTGPLPPEVASLA